MGTAAFATMGVSMSELKTGSNAGITPPTWAGHRALPRPAEGLGYDWSRHAQITNEPGEWKTALGRVKQQLATSDAFLRDLADFDFPPFERIGEVPQGVRDTMDGARTAIYPKRLDLGDPKNEVPNYLPDGSIHPDEVSTRLHDARSARVDLESVLFRMDKANVPKHAAGVAEDALKLADDFTYALTYQVEGRAIRDRPDIAGSRRIISDMEAMLDTALARGDGPKPPTGPRPPIDTKPPVDPLPPTGPKPPKLDPPIGGGGAIDRAANRFGALPKEGRAAILLGGTLAVTAGFAAAGFALADSMKD
ncbi:MAG: hypothetical protein JWM90_2782 [Thermoleophilia bacterium]|nr:hypothetical protein [Thermoleophilia bacterium]